MKKVNAYVGTWGSDIQGSENLGVHQVGGIHVFTVDDNEEFILLENVCPQVNAGIIAISENKQFLYCVNERKDLGGVYGNGGGICSFEIDKHTGRLQLISEVSSMGAYPCYIVTEPKGNYVFAVNHGHHDDVVTKLGRDENGKIASLQVFDDGSLVMYRIKEDGSLSECTDARVYQVGSINPRTQKSAHPHSVAVDPTGKFVLVADKGADKIFVYKIDTTHHLLIDWMEIKTTLGKGPRHMAFHPNLALLYINGEIDSTVDCYYYDFEEKVMWRKQSLKTIPQPYVPKDPTDHFANNETADIRVHPSGKFLYVSNRGHNSIARFYLNELGEIAFSGYTYTEGEIPRAINFNDSVDKLVAVNQRTGNLVPFNIDNASGELIKSSEEIMLHNPVCIEFICFE